MTRRINRTTRKKKKRLYGGSGNGSVGKTRRSPKAQERIAHAKATTATTAKATTAKATTAKATTAKAQAKAQAKAKVTTERPSAATSSLLALHPQKRSERRQPRGHWEREEDWIESGAIRPSLRPALEALRALEGREEALERARDARQDQYRSFAEGYAPDEAPRSGPQLRAQQREEADAALAEAAAAVNERMLARYSVEPQRFSAEGTHPRDKAEVESTGTAYDVEVAHAIPASASALSDDSGGAMMTPPSSMRRSASTASDDSGSYQTASEDGRDAGGEGRGLSSKRRDSRSARKAGAVAGASNPGGVARTKRSARAEANMARMKTEAPPRPPAKPAQQRSMRKKSGGTDDSEQRRSPTPSYETSLNKSANMSDRRGVSRETARPPAVPTINAGVGKTNRSLAKRDAMSRNAGGSSSTVKSVKSKGNRQQVGSVMSKMANTDSRVMSMKVDRNRVRGAKSASKPGGASNPGGVARTKRSARASANVARMQKEAPPRPSPSTKRQRQKTQIQEDPFAPPGVEPSGILLKRIPVSMTVDAAEKELNGDEAKGVQGLTNIQIFEKIQSMESEIGARLNHIQELEDRLESVPGALPPRYNWKKICDYAVGMAMHSGKAGENERSKYMMHIQMLDDTRAALDTATGRTVTVDNDQVERAVERELENFATATRLKEKRRVAKLMAAEELKAIKESHPNDDVYWMKESFELEDDDDTAQPKLLSEMIGIFEARPPVIVRDFEGWEPTISLNNPEGPFLLVDAYPQIWEDSKASHWVKSRIRDRVNYEAHMRTTGKYIVKIEGIARPVMNLGDLRTRYNAGWFGDGRDSVEIVDTTRHNPEIPGSLNDYPEITLADNTREYEEILAYITNERLNAEKALTEGDVDLEMFSLESATEATLRRSRGDPKHLARTYPPEYGGRTPAVYPPDVLHSGHQANIDRAARAARAAAAAGDDEVVDAQGVPLMSPQLGEAMQREHEAQHAHDDDDSYDEWVEAGRRNVELLPDLPGRLFSNPLVAGTPVRISALHTYAPAETGRTATVIGFTVNESKDDLSQYGKRKIRIKWDKNGAEDEIPFEGDGHQTFREIERLDVDELGRSRSVPLVAGNLGWRVVEEGVGEDEAPSARPRSNSVDSVDINDQYSDGGIDVDEEPVAGGETTEEEEEEVVEGGEAPPGQWQLPAEPPWAGGSPLVEEEEEEVVRRPPGSLYDAVASDEEDEQQHEAEEGVDDVDEALREGGLGVVNSVSAMGLDDIRGSEQDPFRDGPAPEGQADTVYRTVVAAFDLPADERRDPTQYHSFDKGELIAVTAVHQNKWSSGFKISDKAQTVKLFPTEFVKMVNITASPSAP